MIAVSAHLASLPSFAGVGLLLLLVAAGYWGAVVYFETIGVGLGSDSIPDDRP